MQPPPRGCVLKQVKNLIIKFHLEQPPPRGCVLKPFLRYFGNFRKLQPPPRGCVLKPFFVVGLRYCLPAAASARLCVETLVKIVKVKIIIKQPPPRGCVLKP